MNSIRQASSCVFHSDCLQCVQIFDAFIIVSSFTIDIIFLGGVAGEEGQKAAAVLVILLLWRIARVVDGIQSTLSLAECSDQRHAREQKLHPSLPVPAKICFRHIPSRLVQHLIEYDISCNENILLI